MGNSVLVSTDLDGELEGRTRLAAFQSPGSNSLEAITLSASHQNIGFGRGYSVADWERLLRGERIEHSRPIPELGAGYIDSRGRNVHRRGNWEQMEHVGSTLVWTVELGEALDSHNIPIEGADQTVTMHVSFSPEFVCHVCLPEFPDACFGGEDPTNSSEFCRNAIETFRLVEHNFVDAAMLEM